MRRVNEVLAQLFLALFFVSQFALVVTLIHGIWTWWNWSDFKLVFIEPIVGVSSLFAWAFAKAS